MNNENKKIEQGCGSPVLVLYHPNAKCNGSAIAVNINPATFVNDGDVQFFVAAQASVGDPAATEEEKRYAKFDWENAAKIHLSVIETAEVMMVLGGQVPSLVHAGKEGIYFNGPDATKSVTMKRAEDPNRPGFLMGVGVTPKADPNARHYHTFCFRPAEAFALREALRCKMGELAFGVKPATLSFGPVNPKEV